MKIMSLLFFFILQCTYHILNLENPKSTTKSMHSKAISIGQEGKYHSQEIGDTKVAKITGRLHIV